MPPASPTGSSRAPLNPTPSQHSLNRPEIQFPNLPTLRESPQSEREQLFLKKLDLCSYVFDFNVATQKRAKDIKRQTLLELVDYVNTPAGQAIFTEAVMASVVKMVKENVGRSLPPTKDDFDPEEDEPQLEPSWPHLQVVYEFFLRFIVSGAVLAKTAKRFIDQNTCLTLINLFDSEDPRERDYLKTILHRIYGKFMTHRSFIRRNVSNIFYGFVYEKTRHNGIGELLEILGSIINGFAIPLKKEHVTFLSKALLPLHKPKCVNLYHQQLSYCIIQYVEKDGDTGITVIRGLISCWPWTDSQKQVLLINELEELLELLGYEQLQVIQTELFRHLARLIGSDHFQVAERALFLWNNEHLVNAGCLSRQLADVILPLIYDDLLDKCSHWNQTVEGLAQSVQKMYIEFDPSLYESCAAGEKDRGEKKASFEERALAGWKQIDAMATSNR
ncbi:hypothetical protein TrVE_jg9992 [Triparma verrucosa]|uniref:Serine/threonine protein phosphatase 2A regulatory subunit n=1 Tax=Triparma verrucosa TaxID=1606542 RepID=A0A9W7BXB1_9STRA|nr:hypothetical protein TrVE_jg9992 [Triparma verrucosa]